MTTNLPSTTLAYRDTTTGSPWIVTREGLQVIAERTRNGVSMAQIAMELGMSPRTLDRLIGTDEDVQDAIAMGKGGLETEIVGLILKGARDGDASQQRFLARNVLGFRDTGRESRTPAGPQPSPVTINIPGTMTDEQLEVLTAKYRDVTPADTDDKAVTPPSITSIERN
ncbi:hypothetical protein [Parasulfitobacter algicola]|uniref:Uncharacterized protein n=1 Tax=Parasulfitobacter algicola TaxID=2614809 RepID=A0ABX2ITS9_9RHOB|nr:hypothetical protein [Sulfitobacter algicola]NSX56313.1 hypothetical protein [Sulfitobacter algicola]